MNETRILKDLSVGDVKNVLVEQLMQYEKTAIECIVQASRIRLKLMEEYRLENKDKESTLLEDVKIAQVPFAAYEMQLERFQEEKKDLLDRHAAELDKVRKHDKHIILGVCGVLAAIILGFFGTVVYILENYEFMGMEQFITTGEYGTATIEDGIHYNTD